jgi:tRNA (mo5U34)-methyltransferase
MTSPISPDFRARIDQFDWYQRIPLGDGYETPGEDTFTTQKLSMLEIPADLTGKSVLDIGCSEGFFAREVERRGASHIVGIDTAPGLSDKNALLKEITGSRFEFREQTVSDLAPETSGIFDLIIFLSVFQHLDFPFQALNLISAVTGVTAIMEVPVAVSLANDPAFQQAPFAIMRRSGKGRRIFLPNESMLFEMLLDAGFSSTDRLIRHRPREIPGYHGLYGQERLILKAHKGDARL